MNTVEPESAVGLAAERRGMPEIPAPALKTPPDDANASLPTDTAHSILPIAVHARGLSLTILAALAGIYTLYWAQKFFILLVFGILVSYMLNPLVHWLERIKIPRIIGTTLVMGALLGGITLAGQSLYAEFQSIMESLPKATRQLSRAVLRAQKGQVSTVQQMQAAASEIEKAANPAANGRPGPKQPSVVVSQPTIRLSELLWAGSMSVIGLIGEVTMVLLLVFFLLLSGDTFKRKLVRLAGPSISSKKTTLNILEDIHTSIQNYMFMLLTTNTVLALSMWAAFRWLGLENAGAWALAAGLLHVIPYFGPLLIALTSGVTAFMQFESFSKMLLVSGSSLVIATLVGMLMTTWMTGKIAKMNAAAVFIILLFWGWLWGIWGMLLGIPIIVIVKVIAEHIEGWQTITDLLSE